MKLFAMFLPRFNSYCVHNELFSGNIAKLEVEESFEDDSGLYTIICENQVGEVRADVNVIVRP